MKIFVSNGEYLCTKNSLDTAVGELSPGDICLIIEMGRKSSEGNDFEYRSLVLHAQLGLVWTYTRDNRGTIIDIDRECSADVLDKLK